MPSLFTDDRAVVEGVPYILPYRYLGTLPADCPISQRYYHAHVITVGIAHCFQRGVVAGA